MKIDRNFKLNITFYLIYELFLGVFVGAYMFLLGPYILSLGYKENLVGTVSLIQTLSFAGFAYIAGIFSSKFTDKALFAFVSISSSLSGIMFIFSKNIILVIAGVLLYSLAISTIVVIKTPFLIRTTKGFNTVKVIGMVLTYCVTTNLIGNFLSGKILSLFGYNFSWIFFSLFAIFSIIPAFLIKTEKAITQKEKTNNKLQFDKRMLFLVSYTSLGAFGYGLIGPYYTTYLINKLNLDTFSASFINNFSIIGMIAAMLLSPYAAKKFGKTKTLWDAKVYVFPVLLLLVFIKNNILFFSTALGLLYFLRSFFLNIPIPVESDLILKSVPENYQDKFNSIIVFANNFTVSISSFVAGFIISDFNFGYEITFTLSAIIFIIQGYMFLKFSAANLKNKA
ncbi:Major Facilitator Superfamily protein [Caloramator mitchellensis]|uniref:Major Facilitator Superfamily protein n=1 Tax=Caloramator mitchellensis TaxID=908809 RepID=A0A0R3JTL8_CALMK|nr:MFS transporter [Caloramator mitchellensis]KRQ86886.1 Major Facilitator Superfamily protein [Caloramator mitchellensis]